MDSDLLEKKDTITTPANFAPGDHDLFAHYAKKKDIEDSMFNGVEIVALCGKKWRPSRDFAKYPVCPECKEKWEAMEWRDGQPQE